MQRSRAQCILNALQTVTVTVTEALVLRSLLEDRGRITESIRNPGARRQNEKEMFSDHDETSPSIAAVSAPSVACSMLAVHEQKRLCRQFVDVSAARRGCHTMQKADPSAHFCLPCSQCLKERRNIFRGGCAQCIPVSDAWSSGPVDRSVGQ